MPSYRQICHDHAWWPKGSVSCLYNALTPPHTHPQCWGCCVLQPCTGMAGEEYHAHVRV